MRSEDFQSARVQMEFKRFAQQIAVDAGVMAEMELSVGQGGYDFLRDQIMVRMVTKLLADDLPPEKVRQSTRVDVEEPASTWQMWKRNNRGRWYTKWWLDKWLAKWPVRTWTCQKVVHCEFDLERYRAYPQARIQAPVLGRAVMFHDIRNVRWWEDTDPTVQNEGGE